MQVLLNLTIKRRWFDMIASGVKREEYRSWKNKQVTSAFRRWTKGLADEDSVMILRNGYYMDSSALAVRIFAMGIRSGGQAAHPEWGEPTGKGSHFVVVLDNVLTRGTYASVRRYCLDSAAGRIPS